MFWKVNYIIPIKKKNMGHALDTYHMFNYMFLSHFEINRQRKQLGTNHLGNDRGARDLVPCFLLFRLGPYVPFLPFHLYTKLYWLRGTTNTVGPMPNNKPYGLGHVSSWLPHGEIKVRGTTLTMLDPIN